MVGVCLSDPMLHATGMAGLSQTSPVGQRQLPGRSDRRSLGPLKGEKRQEATSANSLDHTAQNDADGWIGIIEHSETLICRLTALRRWIASTPGPVFHSILRISSFGLFLIFQPVRHRLA